MSTSCLFGEVISGFDEEGCIFDILNPKIMITKELTSDSYNTMKYNYKSMISSSNLPVIMICWACEDGSIYIDSRIIEDVLQLTLATNFEHSTIWNNIIGEEITVYQLNLRNSDWVNIKNDFWEVIPDIIKRFTFAICN